MLKSHTVGSGGELPRNPLLSEQAVSLDGQKVGPDIRMLHESVLSAEMRNPHLPEMHAAEGAKFSAFARKVAPPELVIQHIRQTAAIYPIIGPLDEKAISDAFAMVIQNTESRSSAPAPGALPYRKYPYSESRDYLEYCAKDPNIFLGCHYLSLALQTYAFQLKDQIRCPHMGGAVDALGKNFNAKNMVSQLPAAICTSLLALHGRDAVTAQIDREVVSHALNTLHEQGRFEIRGRGPGGAVAVLQCPMEGYLFELLGKHDALAPIFEGLERMREDLAVRGVTKHDLPLLKHLQIHRENTDAVRGFVRRALTSLT